MLLKTFESLKAEAARLRENNERLEKQNKQLEKEIRQLKAQDAQAQVKEISERLLAEKSAAGGLASLISPVPGLEGHQSLRILSDALRKKEKLAVLFLADPLGNCVVSCNEEAQKAGMRADALLKLAAEVAGGSGGGKGDFAQGRLKEPSKFAELRKHLEEYIRKHPT